MPIDIDGFAILGAIASRPELFPTLKADASAYSRKLVEKRLKDKALNIEDFVEVAAALTPRQFVLFVEGMSDAATKTLVAKLDKHNPRLKTETAQWRRSHLSALGKAEVAPSPPPAKTSKPRAATRKPEVVRAVASKAMRAGKGA